MLQQAPQADVNTDQQRFETLLSGPDFAGLKAILDQLSPDRALLFAEVRRAPTYEELIARLGYQLILTKQIHIQDCYSRLGRAGGIKAVLPCFDISTHSAVPTLVNYEDSVTTTPKSAAFFNAMLVDLKKALFSQVK